MKLHQALDEVSTAIGFCKQGVLDDDYARAVDLLADSLRNDGTIYFVGNGGSAADAQHLAAELIGRMRFDREPLRGVALTTDTSALTALVNDYDPVDIFARQVRALVREADVLIAISTSGMSPNVVSAAAQAKVNGARVVSLTRSGPTDLAEISDVILGVPADATPVIQVLHILLGQALLEDVELALGLRPPPSRL